MRRRRGQTTIMESLIGWCWLARRRWYTIEWRSSRLLRLHWQRELSDENGASTMTSIRLTAGDSLLVAPNHQYDTDRLVESSILLFTIYKYTQRAWKEPITIILLSPCWPNNRQLKKRWRWNIPRWPNSLIVYTERYAQNFQTFSTS